MSLWLIVTTAWPGVAATATDVAANHLVAVALTVAAALTLGCGSLLRRHRDRRARRAAIG